MSLVMAIRAASICRLVIHAGSSDWRPYSPKATDVPPLARPRRCGRCCLRCFTRLGMSIGFLSLLGPGGGGAGLGLLGRLAGGLGAAVVAAATAAVAAAGAATAAPAAALAAGGRARPGPGPVGLLFLAG